MHFATALLMLPVAALAIQITSPANNATWDTSASHQVEWTTVSTDPTSFSILLVNQAKYPPVSVTLADGISSSSSPYTVEASVLAAQSASETSGWQINFVNKTTTAILAQSNQFNIEHDSASSSSSSSSTSTSTSAVPTVVVTSSTKSGSMTTSVSKSSASSSAASTTGSSTVAASSSATSSGAVASHTNAAAGLLMTNGGVMGAAFAVLAALL